MKCTMRRAKRAILFGALGATMGSAAAQMMPKEGNFDTSSCWSGVSNLIVFSKTHSAFSYELTGTARSNTPGGLFDMTTFRCVGIVSIIDGAAPGTALCENIDKEGDKWFSRYVGEGPKYKGEALAGTGKYEGMTYSSNFLNVGPFPVIKPGTFQNCNRQTGTYKLK